MWIGDCSLLQHGSTLAMGEPPLFGKLDGCPAFLLRNSPQASFKLLNSRKDQLLLSCTMTIGLQTFSKSPPLPSLKSSPFFSWLLSGLDPKKCPAYNCQFLGSIVSFSASDIYSSFTEHKCKFFAWLMLHNKVLTAENMLRKNWHCNQTCRLCFPFER
jgi:hypothetical protein